MKVLSRFRADPSADNAKRVVLYLDRHPMSECLLSPEESADVAKARAMFTPPDLPAFAAVGKVRR